MVMAVVGSLYQIWVSVMLLRSCRHESMQKCLQLALIWLIPIFGAAVVHAMMWADRKPPRKPEKGYTEPGDNAS